MPVPTGQASFADIQSNFGGSNPIAISEYYTGGGITKSNIGGFAPNGIPNSGQISVDDFRGATNAGETHSGTMTITSNFFISTTYYGFGALNPGSSMTNRQMTQGTTAPPWRIDIAAFRSSTPKGGSTVNDYYFSGSTNPATPQPWTNSDTGAFKTLTDGSMTVSRANMTFSGGPSNASTSFSYTAPSSTPGFSMNTASSGTRTLTLDCI